MKTNVEATKRQLQQRKFKKFNNLKYKPQPIKEQTPAITQANFKKSYANAVKGGTNNIDPKVQHLRKTSKKKKRSKKNHQLSCKSWNYYIQLMHNTAVENRLEESLQLQSKHQPIEIQKLKIQGIKLNC